VSGIRTTAIGESSPTRHWPDVLRLSACGRLYFELLGQDPGHFKGKLAAATACGTTARSAVLSTGPLPTLLYKLRRKSGCNSRYCGIKLSALSIHLSESRSEAGFIFDGVGSSLRASIPLSVGTVFSASGRCMFHELLDRHGLLTPKLWRFIASQFSCRRPHHSSHAVLIFALCPAVIAFDGACFLLPCSRKIGISLALGTDPGSNNSLSPGMTALCPGDLFPGRSSGRRIRMVTTGGAAALGILQHALTEAGKRADFQ